LTRITKLVMQGFKSFAQKTEIVLGPGFNCVLGPNGSGKSNVMDALCFVLGKSSSKELRAEKSANLIYNGGKTKNPAKEANVTIYFDNSEKEFPIDDAEVKLSRTVKEAGNSVYKINNKTVTRMQVVELLNNARINPDGYNIVLQGDIVRIVEMTPLERRRIIEEIAGISIYEEKKQKALNELEKVEERLKESDIILAEREAYLRELKKDRNEAMKFKELDEKLKRNKATLVFMKLNVKQKRRDILDKEIADKKTEIIAIQKEIDALKKEVLDKKAEIQAINKEIEEKGDKDQVHLQKIIEELKVSIGTNNARISSLENELKRVGERKLQLETSAIELADKIKRLEIEKQAFEKSYKDKEKQVEQINSKIEGFKSKHKIEDSGNLEKEIEELDKASDAKLKEIQEAREGQQNLLREKDKFEYQIITADEKILKVLEVKKEHEKDIENLKSIRQDFKKATLELNTRLNEDSSLSAQLGNARARLLKTKEELGKLSVKQSTLQESSGRDISIQRILENKEKLKGIFGTVSGLGQVSNEYALAMEVAAGPKIRSIVVESDKVAADCIKFLKSNKLGSATFLPLNKIKPAMPQAEVTKVLGQPGVKGLAATLIKYDPKFRNVFSYVFGNTLVVDNIDTARRLGIGNFRVATMDGDLTETSGAMHGGFRKRAEGSGFQEREIASKIDALEKEEGDINILISGIDRKKAENEEQITALRHKKAELEAEIIKVEKSLHLEEGDLDINKNIKKEMQEKIKEIDGKLKDVNSAVLKANSDLVQIKIKKQQMRDKINALKNPALLAELNTFEQKRSELKEEMIRISAESKNIDVQISTILLPEQNNTKKILKQHEKEEEDFAKEMASLKDLIRIQEKDLKEKEAAQKVFYAKFKELFKKRDSVSEDVSKAETKQYKREDTRRTEEVRMNNLSLENAKIIAELEGLQTEYKQYEGIPTFDGKEEEKIKQEIWEFDKMVRDMGAVNMRALEIYDAVEKEYNSILDKKELLSKEKEDVLLMMNEIETKKKDLFMNTYDVINKNFQQRFMTLSTKGEATMDLEDPETVFQGGLNLKVRLTGKKFLDIRSLSGGEKTMTALAFLFSVQDHEPAPFYVLDEVDAALDKRNSEKLAQLVREYISKAQYLVISHNDGVISEADSLYGVSMNEHGISKVVSLRI
jgi:chromosome segregation protein